MKRLDDVWMLDDSKKQLNDVTFHDIGWLDVFFSWCQMPQMKLRT